MYNRIIVNKEIIMIQRTITVTELMLMEDEELFETNVYLNGEWQPVWCMSNFKGYAINGHDVKADDVVQIQTGRML